MCQGRRELYKDFDGVQIAMKIEGEEEISLGYGMRYSNVDWGGVGGDSQIMALLLCCDLADCTRDLGAIVTYRQIKPDGSSSVIHLSILISSKSVL